MSDFATWAASNKSLWTRVYDEVLAPDLEKEWKKREKKHLDELNQRDENQQLLFNHINEQIIKNAQVLEENERLENELLQRDGSAATSADRGDAVTAAAGVSEEQHRQLAEKYDDLSKKYHDLSQKVKYLERKNNAVMQKNRDMKDSVRAWQQYADRQKPHQKLSGAKISGEGPSKLIANPQNDEALPHMLSSSGPVSSITTPFRRTSQGHTSPAPDALHIDYEAGDGALIFEEFMPSPNDVVTPEGPVAALSGDRHVTIDRSLNPRLDRTRRHHADINGAPNSSQTTVDEAPDQLNTRIQAVQVEDEGDVPQVVSERSLKRKRNQQRETGKPTGRFSDGTPAKPHCVKDEPLSSSPPAMHLLMRTETIDLDDPTMNDAGTSCILQNSTSRHSKIIGTMRHQRSGSAPVSQAANQDAEESELGTDSRFSDFQSKPQDVAADMRALSEPTDPRSQDDILQPLDLNVIAQDSTLVSSKRLKQATWRTEHGVLAESGEALSPVDENELRLPPSAARARFQRLRAATEFHTPANRSQYLLASKLPFLKQEEMTSPSVSKVRPAQSLSSSNGSRKSASNPRPNQEVIVPGDRPIWSLRASGSPSAKHKRDGLSFKTPSRLREKQVKELRVCDFRPNPAYNQGYSHAFSETVRKRGDRMCLPGCTNSRCCGSHFRRLAEALDPLSATQEEALLEDYLGDAYSHVMSTQMSSDERNELVLQARTKKMAKDNGKHREAFERRRTPPGFWRVDFPTTQEQEDDRERAKEQEVRIVQERWLEAQKKSGRWVFRDE